MNKIILLLAIIFSPALLHAQGMYIPSLLDSAVMADMNAKGCRLTAEEIYSYNHNSLKDAVPQFGGGCTAGMISNEGLLVTNHHCGLSQVQRHSTVEHDYLTNGFWAASRLEEIPCPGLTITFVIRIDDVTDSIIPFLNNLNAANETSRQNTVDSLSEILEQHAIANSHYESFVRAFYNGNQYFRFITQVYSDVRLVGAPPISIGNFGGDTDNWMWPRHTGDFSLFRIYADKDNNPAAYNKDNIPYKPAKFLPISIKEKHEGDFTMVYGFPGKTQLYLTSDAVNLIANVSDSIKVNVRTQKLQTWENAMKANDTIRIQYQSKYNGIANGWKKWQGEIKGINECNVPQLKKDFQNTTIERSDIKIQSAGSIKDKIKFQSASFILGKMKVLYDSLRQYQALLDYTTEALLTPEVFKYAGAMDQLAKYLSKENTVVNDSLKDALRKGATAFYKNVNINLDAATFKSVLPLYRQHVSAKWQPGELIEGLSWQKFHGDYVTDLLYATSIMGSESNTNRFIDKLNEKKSVKKILNDPIYKLYASAIDMNNSIIDKYQQFNNQLTTLNRLYMKSIMDLYPEKNIFPDANLTLRISYGTIKPYQPRDGVAYKWFTTTEGILQKCNSALADDYVLLPKYKELLEKKDFGQYASADGTLHTGFIAANHTTGGNSGSPVLDADGNLIGLNFDRVWEGTMSDIYFDSTRCRNISLDTRYFLFIVDKYAGASYLLNEMKIVK